MNPSAEVNGRKIEFEYLGFSYYAENGSHSAFEFCLRKKHCTSVMRNYIKRIVRNRVTSAVPGKAFRVRVFTRRPVTGQNRKDIQKEGRLFSLDLK